MRYVLAVKQPPSAQGATLALQLARALLKADHQISQIFFFQDGVNNANGLINPANDEPHCVKQWQLFAAQTGVPLHLCIAAAQRRGVVDAQTSASAQTNLADGFRLAGLGEFSKAVLEADRLLTF